VAEYNEVIKQFKRMCWYFSRDKMQKSCPMCTSYPNCNIGQCRKIAFEKPDFAATVMRWAAEHPEPIYPTWGEWLESEGICFSRLTDYERVHGFKIPKVFEYQIDGKTAFICGDRVNSPIPPDIAQKLGLQPK
jgi:hypothetical protein